MQAMVSRFGIVTDTAGLNAKNAAAVMVTSELPPFIKPGQKMDVTVSTVGGAKSLRGGTLPGTSYDQSQAYVKYIRRLQQGQSGFTCYASLQMPR